MCKYRLISAGVTAATLLLAGQAYAQFKLFEITDDFTGEAANEIRAEGEKKQLNIAFANLSKGKLERDNVVVGLVSPNQICALADGTVQVEVVPVKANGERGYKITLHWPFLYDGKPRTTLLAKAPRKPPAAELPEDVLYRLAANQLLNLFSTSAQVKIRMTDACTGEITDTFDTTGFAETAAKLE